MNIKVKPRVTFMRFNSGLMIWISVAAAVFLFAPKALTQPAPATGWDKLVAGAQKEGQVRVITAMGQEVRKALVNGFKSRYGIDAECVTMRGSEIAQKLGQERRAGLFLWDIYIGGTTTTTEVLSPAGMFDPIEPNLILPEVRNPAVYWHGKLPLYSYGQAISVVKYPRPNILINTNLVKPSEIKAWKDLLNPKWKGKILMDDPTVSGAGGAMAAFIYVNNIAGGADFFRKLITQAPAITVDRLQLSDWIARGKYAISLFARPEITKPFIDNGAPVKYITPEELIPITHAGAAAALFNNPAHPNAAKVFLNWVLTKDAGELWSRAQGVQSSRNDVSTDHIPDYLVRQPGGNYFDTDDDEYTQKEQKKATKAIKAIFAAYLKK